LSYGASGGFGTLFGQLLQDFCRQGSEISESRGACDYTRNCQNRISA